MRRTALAFVGVLAIAIQCLAIQTHVHAWTDPRAQAEAAADESGAAGAANQQQMPASPHRHGGSGLCYICQTAAAGTAILTTAPSMNYVGVQRQRETAAIEVTAPIGGSPSHIWRSRAPPLQL